MGTTLTGTTPQDTYDSLIKVTDNGPLSGTLKKLTDGLGNDSSLSLSTTAASLSGTLAVTGDSTLSQLDLVASIPALDLVFAPNTAFKHTIEGTNYSSSPPALNTMTLKVASAANTQANVMTLNGAGNVGIGTSTPATTLHVANSSAATVRAEGTATNGEATVQLLGKNSSGTARSAIFKYDNSDLVRIGISQAVDIRFETNDVERMRILAGGGLTFNGDTAAANALDDYEEGTWTPVFEGCTFTGTTTATYTKIGRKVTVQLSFVNQTISSPDATQPRITGLPFTSSNAYQAGSITYADIFTTDASVYVQNSNTRLYFQQGTSSTSAAYNTGTSNRSLMLTATYFV